MRYSRGGALSVLLLTAGCMEPHNDVLIFGTNTKFAVDVSASAATGGVPELSVGYKRQEAVWMPLLVNGRDSKLVEHFSGIYETCLADAGDDKAEKGNCRNDYANALKYVGSSGGSVNGGSGGVGGTVNDKDAYSVFASFGATFGAEGGSGTAEAQGGIAQFFATGVAAQRLGGNASIGNALSVKPVGEKQIAAAEARAEAAEAQITVKRAADFAKAEAQDQVEQLLDSVDQLPDGAAKKIIDSPPSPFDSFTSDAITRRFGGVAGPTNEADAKAMLKMIVVLIEDRSADNLTKWKAAIDAEKQ